MFTVTITKTTIEEQPGLGKLVRSDEGKHSYTPDIMKKNEVELKIYEQTVEEIDITRVISAVNGGLYEMQPKLHKNEKDFMEAAFKG